MHEKNNGLIKKISDNLDQIKNEYEDINYI